MKMRYLAAAAVVAVSLVSIAAEVSGAALNGSSPGGIAPKPATIQAQRTYAIQCDSASCFKVSGALQSDGGLAVDCTADYNLAAGESHQFESAAAAYLSVGAVADGGTAGCRLFAVSKNKR